MSGLIEGRIKSHSLGIWKVTRRQATTYGYTLVTLAIPVAYAEDADQAIMAARITIDRPFGGRIFDVVYVRRQAGSRRAWHVGIRVEERDD